MNKFSKKYKKKLIIFCPSIEEGGVEKNLFLIANHISRKNVEVNIISANYDKKKKFNSRINFYSPTTFFWNKKPRIIKSFLCSYILLKNFYGENINILSFQSNIFAIILAKILNCKVTIRSNTSPQIYINFFKKFLFRKLFKLADNIIVNSKDFKKKIDKEFHIKSIAIYNPILNKRKKNNTIPIIFPQENSIKLLNIARLTKQKDHRTLLLGIKYYIEKYNNKINLVIIGKGKEEQNIKDFIIKNDLQKNIKLLGYVNNADRYLDQCDIFILSSIAEGLPNVLLEALHEKKIVISSNCETGPREILENGKNGYLFKIYDYRQLAKKIYLVTKNFTYSKQKAFRGYRSLNRFDINKIVNKYYKTIFL